MSESSIRRDKDSLNAQLREALHFTEDDLAANHAGQLTSSQLPHQMRQTAEPIFSPGLIMVVFLALVFLGFSALWQIIGFVVVPLLLVVPWLVIVQRSVKVVEGKLTQHEQPSSDPREPMMHYIKVEELDFIVPDHAFNSFVNGLQYRIFYTPFRQQAVAAELVELLEQDNP